jgi:hypothetical protein
MRKRLKKRKRLPKKVYQPNNQKSWSVAEDVFSLRRRRRCIAVNKQKRHASPAEESNQKKKTAGLVRTPR